MLNRQLEILIYLNEVKKSTLVELANKFEVSKRTIMRDINSIAALGVPITTQSGYQGGVFIHENYKFTQSFFTPKEIADIVLALHIVENLRKNNTKNSILKKLEFIIPELVYVKEKDLRDYFQIELFDKPLFNNKEIFKRINQALDEDVMILIKHQGQQYQVVPLYYSLKGTGFYINAVKDNELCAFDMTDITECTLTKIEFKREMFAHFLKNEPIQATTY